MGGHGSGRKPNMVNRVFPIGKTNKGDNVVLPNYSGVKWDARKTSPVNISANVAGNDGEVQFNSSGSFGADSKLFWDNVNKYLGIGTSSADGILHLDNGTSDTHLIIEKDDATEGLLIFHNDGAQAGYLGLESNEVLALQSDVLNGDIRFRINDGGSTYSAFNIDGSTGNLGIGADNFSPSFQLSVKGASALGQIERNSNTVSPGFLFDRTRGTPGSEANIVAGDELGKVQFRGRIAGTVSTYGYLSFVASDTSQNGYFRFTDSANSELLRIRTSGDMELNNDNAKLLFGAGQDASITYDGTNMIFDSQEVGTGNFSFTNGNVGIGNANPGAPLHITGTTGSGNNGIRFSNGIRTYEFYGSSGNFIFRDVSGATDRITVDSTGDVGIGISPTTKLDIDSNSNTQCLRLRGANATTEIADFYVRNAGNLAIDLTGGNSTNQYLEIRTESSDYGFIIRESDGTGLVPYANFYVVDSTDDYMTVNLNSTTDADALVVTAADYVGVGTIPTSKLHVDQSSTTGAVPVITLDQGDVSEEFMRFIGQAAASNGISQSLVDAGGSQTPTVEGYVRVYISDDNNQITDGIYFIPFYSLTV